MYSRRALAALSFSPLLAFADDITPEKQEQIKLLLGSAGVQAEMAHGMPAVAIVVPIASFVFGFAVIFASLYWRFRQQQERQLSIRLMVEKGMPVPPELLLTREVGGQQKDFRRGLLLTFLGIVIPVAMLISEPGSRDWVWGFIPLAMGVAYLISARAAQKSA